MTTEPTIDIKEEELLVEMEDDSNPLKSERKKLRERKLQTNWTSEQTHVLIAEVEMREALWNFSIPQYKNRNKREALWEEIAQKMQVSKSEITNKWNSMRTIFRMNYNKLQNTKSGHGIEKPSKNEFYTCMMFLEPTLRLESNKAKSSSDFIQLGNLSSSSHSRKSHRMEPNDTNDDEVVERALEALSSRTKTDTWDDVGNFIAMNGRRWGSTNPRLEAKFRSLLYKLVSDIELEAVNYIDFKVK